ncbi:universal stress protein [Streptomyces sp. bgisy060]|uniref:universal stress protein n=1 Tax=Streptomyces sp. bgisy060 TaxID=3413775 RepID=UPI003EB79068
MNDVLAGVDPRDLSVSALIWAADEAARRGLRLRLVVAVPPVHERFWYDALAHHGALRIRAESALANAEDLVRDLHPGLRTTTELVAGAPAAVLREGSAHAALVVVGSRRLGPAAELLSEGSVVVPLTAHADCPVVVVRSPEHTATHPPTLVVGVDGSEGCREAVSFAVREASLREAHLRAVWVWPRSLRPHGGEEEGVAERRRLLSEAVAGWAEQYPDVRITGEVLRGHPVEQLAHASREALALVIGRRGRGGYAGMRLGSTVHGLVHRAECPVVVAPLPEREGRRGGRPPAGGPGQGRGAPADPDTARRGVGEQDPAGRSAEPSER